jgi:acetylornithine deacetylase
MDYSVKESIELLKNLIGTPSFSRDESKVAEIIRNFLNKKNIPFYIKNNNTWAKSKHFDNAKPVILLDGHIDTVKPVDSWTIDPFTATEKDGKIYGLGSNDAGASLVSLLQVFIFFYDKKLPYNLIFSATAEEEVSGSNGIASIIDELGKVNLAIIGEPTKMQLAIAEKGLLVVDCEATGLTGHAARNEGINAIYKAIEDINIIKNFEFPKISPLLGKVKLTVTQINAGYQHNIIPDKCTFVIDIRTNELYSNEEAFELIKSKISSTAKARSFRLQSSSISVEHPIVKEAQKLGLECFGSPTTSNQALIPFTSVKIGPGDSARSHTADEYICINEIEEGIKIYIELLKNLNL